MSANIAKIAKVTRIRLLTKKPGRKSNKDLDLKKKKLRGAKCPQISQKSRSLNMAKIARITKVTRFKT